MNDTKKVALVTGSRRGIGYAIALELAKDDYLVVLSDVISQEESLPIMSELKALQYDIDYITCDISKESDRSRIFETIQDRYNRLDLLVNNAGVAPQNRLDVLETTEESFDFVLDINLKGTFFMCQTASNCMIKMMDHVADYHPRIINISSMSAYTSSTNRGEYCISKAGISMVTNLYADRIAEYGIPVFEIRPGIIMTDMTAAVTEKYQKLIDEGITPIKRYGQAKDVADCVMAAVSGRLDFATGQVLNADGGFHIRRL